MRISSSLLILAPFAASAALFAACGGGTVSGVDDDDAGSSGAATSSSSGETTSSSGDAATGMPNLADLPADEFSFLKPGGETICATGSEYGFAVRPGDPTKVVIEFEGGGACFNDFTCSHPYSKGAESAVFKDFASAESYAGADQVGLRDHGNTDNPVKGWTHIIVPYCSADVHWGDKETTYGENTIQHRGAKNTKSVMDYVFAQVAAPKQVFVTGCSAGGYGSIYHTPEVRAHYSNAKVSHFSDSAAGVFPETYFPILRDTWGFQSTFPTAIGSADDFKTLAYLYQGIGAKYPDTLLSQYNVIGDTTQSTFLALMGGSGWSDGMLANVGELVNTMPNNFRTYLSPGSVHCIIEKDEMYSKTVGGTKLTDWMKAVVADEKPANVACPTCTLPAKADAGTGDAGN